MSFVLGVKTKTTMTLFLIETVFFFKKNHFERTEVKCPGHFCGEGRILKKRMK